MTYPLAEKGQAAGTPDHDYYKHGTTSSPGAITDLQYSEGGVYYQGTGDGQRVPDISAWEQMFFDPNHGGALRAGIDQGSYWDNANTGYGSWAGGFNTQASGAQSIAHGTNTTASSNQAIATGDGTQATGQRSVAMGLQTIASGEQSTAFGNNTTASGIQSMAIGVQTMASGNESLAHGWLSRATNNGAVALGHDNESSGMCSTTTGGYSVASGDFSTSVGFANQSTAFTSFSSGMNNQSNNGQTVAMGYGNTANGNQAIAMGNGCTANGDQSLAVGFECTTNHIKCVSVGNQCTTNGSNSIAMGQNCTTNGDQAVALGNVNTSTGNQSFSMGYLCEAHGTQSVAQGLRSKVNTGADWSTAWGIDQTVDADNVFAFGNTPATHNQPNCFNLMNVSQGINTTTPTESLDVIGNVKASGVFITSDEQYKENIQKIDTKQALEAILNIDPVLYQWTDMYDPEQKQAGGRKKTHAGVIAQTVQKAAPEAVKEVLQPAEYGTQKQYETNEYAGQYDEENKELQTTEQWDLVGYSSGQTLAKTAQPTGELSVEPMALIAYLIGAVQALEAEMQIYKHSVDTINNTTKTITSVARQV